MIDLSVKVAPFPVPKLLRGGVEVSAQGTGFVCMQGRCGSADARYISSPPCLVLFYNRTFLRGDRAIALRHGEAALLGLSFPRFDCIVARDL